MKVGILTHPLRINYGGILQAYALKEVLLREGYDPIEIDLRPKRRHPLRRLASAVLRPVRKLFGGKRPLPDRGVRIRRFVESGFRMTAPADTTAKAEKICRENGLKGVIVGSDQVWRSDFARNYGFGYFLDFVPYGVRKIAYAASFGLDEWGYTPGETTRIKDLLALFDGVSVREQSGLELLRKNTGTPSGLHLDPTLLLTPADYDRIAGERPIEKPFVFIYWLGNPEEIEEERRKHLSLGLEIFEICLRGEEELPGVEEWIAGIKYADRVITDSFHGAVFSLLYSRPLSVRLNHSGGISRISNLLNLFGATGSEIEPSVNPDIVLSEERRKALSYLKAVLPGDETGSNSSAK